MPRLLLLGMGIVGLVACTHDWDSLDPRLGGGGSASTGGAGHGGAAQGAGTSGGSGPSGGNQPMGGGTSACGDCGMSTPYCDVMAKMCVECLDNQDCEGFGQQCEGHACCAPAGNNCDSEADCCGNTPCQPGGFCGESPSCEPNGNDCMNDGECCSDRCDQGECRPSGGGNGN